MKAGTRLEPFLFLAFYRGRYENTGEEFSNIDERIAHTALRYEPPGVCSRSLAFVKSSNHASRYPVPNDRGS